MYMARELMRAAGGKAMLIAKIERAEAIPALEDIMQRLRRHHGGARRPRGRGGRRRGAGAAEAHDPAGARAEQAHHHRHADDGVDDLEPGADARRGLRRRQRGARRHRRRDAVGRDRPRASTRSRRSRRWTASASRPRSRSRSTLEQEFLNRVFTRVDQSIAMARAVHRLPPQGEGDRLAHRVGLDRAVDVAPQLRRADLRAHRADRDALPLRAVPRRLPADGEVRRPRPRGAAAPRPRRCWCATAW